LKCPEKLLRRLEIAGVVQTGKRVLQLDLLVLRSAGFKAVQFPANLFELDGLRHCAQWAKANGNAHAIFVFASPV
jgi:hypothetical protein